MGKATGSAFLPSSRLATKAACVRFAAWSFLRMLLRARSPKLTRPERCLSDYVRVRRNINAAQHEKSHLTRAPHERLFLITRDTKIVKLIKKINYLVSLLSTLIPDVY